MGAAAKGGSGSAGGGRARLSDVYGADHLLRFLALLPATIDAQSGVGGEGVVAPGGAATQQQQQQQRQEEEGAKRAFLGMLRRLLAYLDTDEVFGALFKR